jgi:hypothetical protein
MDKDRRVAYWRRNGWRQTLSSGRGRVQRRVVSWLNALVRIDFRFGTFFERFLQQGTSARNRRASPR